MRWLIRAFAERRKHLWNMGCSERKYEWFWYDRKKKVSTAWIDFCWLAFIYVHFYTKRPGNRTLRAKWSVLFDYHGWKWNKDCPVIVSHTLVIFVCITLTSYRDQMFVVSLLFIHSSPLFAEYLTTKCNDHYGKPHSICGKPWFTRDYRLSVFLVCFFF